MQYANEFYFPSIRVLALRQRILFNILLARHTLGFRDRTIFKVKAYHTIRIYSSPNAPFIELLFNSHFHKSIVKPAFYIVCSSTFACWPELGWTSAGTKSASARLTGINILTVLQSNTRRFQLCKRYSGARLVKSSGHMELLFGCLSAPAACAHKHVWHSGICGGRTNHNYERREASHKHSCLVLIRLPIF